MVERETDNAEVETGFGKRIFYEVARWRLDEQAQRADSLDRKLAATFTLNGALIAIFGAALGFREEPVSENVWWMFMGVVIMFGLNGLCTYGAFQLRKWRADPNLVDLERVTRRSTGDVILVWTAREMRRAYRDNEIELKRKSCWLRWAFRFGMLDIGLAAATAVVAIQP